MARKLAVSVDPTLLQRFGKSLYSGDQAMIVTRELVQNSVDACKAAGVEPVINVTILAPVYGQGTQITVEDNGIGMTEDVIIEKLLCLGGTTKQGSSYGATGSFGIAKAAIMSCDDWMIESLDNIFDKSMLERGDEIGKQSPIVGTKITVSINQRSYIDSAVSVLAMSKVDGLNITAKSSWSEVQEQGYGLNNPTLVTDVSNTELGTVYVCEPIHYNSTKLISGYNIVRVNGLCQFFWNSSRETNLIFDVDANGSSPHDDAYPFPMSREELRNPYKDFFLQRVRYHDENALSSRLVLQKDAVDRKPKANQNKFFNSKNLVSGQRDYIEDRQSWLWSKQQAQQQIQSLASYAMAQDMMEFAEKAAKKRSLPVDEIAFVLLDDYVPDKSMKAFRLALREVWTKLVQMCADPEDEFGVGFCSNDYGAIASRQSIDGICYYVLNVTRIEESRLLTPEATVQWLYSIAVHETAHYRQKSHNEEFASEMNLISQCTSDRFVTIRNDLAKKLAKGKRR